MNTEKKSYLTNHAGHQIKCDDPENGITLWIDGVFIKVLKTEEGYNLFSDAYIKPFLTLKEAAINHIESVQQSTSRGIKK